MIFAGADARVDRILITTLAHARLTANDNDFRPLLHSRIRGYYRKAVNRFGHATPVHILTMFASVDIKLKSI